MTAGADGVRWRAVDGLRWHALDDEFVVFNPGSWDAHLLNAAAALLLHHLAQQPAAATELSALLQDLLADDAVAHADELTAALLGELRQLGLACPQGCA